MSGGRDGRTLRTSFASVSPGAADEDPRAEGRRRAGAPRGPLRLCAQGPDAVRGGDEFTQERTTQWWRAFFRAHALGALMLGGN